LRTGSSLFVGVGAAHLPGYRGVIELLRRKGYTLRPVKILETDSRQKEAIEKVRVPVQFSRQTCADAMYMVDAPGKLFSFSAPNGSVDMRQYADMSNGSYYMVTRIFTRAPALGKSVDDVWHQTDSVLYEYIPGKILSKTLISKNGYKGWDLTNRTRRGDVQRYNIFVTPFEIILFKMSGNGNYVGEGTEANRFFNSISLREYPQKWTAFRPAFGGFETEFPHQPEVVAANDWQFMAFDKSSATAFTIIRKDVHNTSFVEEDSFDLNLMEESFHSADFIDRETARRHFVFKGFPALDVQYLYKDGSHAHARFLIQGPHYYVLLANAKTENPQMDRFLNSFSFLPFSYRSPWSQTDTSLGFSVSSALPLHKSKKLDMYGSTTTVAQERAMPDLLDNGELKTLLVKDDSTGQLITIDRVKMPRYLFQKDSDLLKDSVYSSNGPKWAVRAHTSAVLPDGSRTWNIVLGDPKSSRCVKGLLVFRKGVTYALQTETDTLDLNDEFITSFYKSFRTSDSVQAANPFEPKSAAFFADYFSADSALHGRALANISQVALHTPDFPNLKRAIALASPAEKQYMKIKGALMSKLSSIPSSECSDLLRSLYVAAGDTIELQYRALSALLHQQTAYAFQVFASIMKTDPPVLNVGVGESDATSTETYTIKGIGGSARQSVDDEAQGGSFFNALRDSLALTHTILKDIVPLVNLHDYEKPVMQLLAAMSDSNLLTAVDIQPLLQKLLMEARQEWKKELIREKSKIIRKSLEEDG
jgi:hypothetical protein